MLQESLILAGRKSLMGKRAKAKSAFGIKMFSFSEVFRAHPVYSRKVRLFACSARFEMSPAVGAGECHSRTVYCSTFNFPMPISGFSEYFAAIRFEYFTKSLCIYVCKFNLRGVNCIFSLFKCCFEWI